ncbi:MAG: quinone-dependent dihydroorotate dehydrogenase [Betaproteobacteria bacterium]
MSLYRLLRPWLFRLDPERAHRWTLSWLDRAYALGALAALGFDTSASSRGESAPVTVMGIAFPNRVGLAAGLDKNAEHIDALAALGFGFIEVGTITPRPQPGNPLPRMFRIPEAQALINRLGFNNLGIDRLVHNIARSKYRGVLGINLGKNFDTPIGSASRDYLTCMRKAYPLASYLTVNISSPNTLDLRTLQEPDALNELLAILKIEQHALAEKHERYVPLVVKIAPDLEDEQIREIANLLTTHGIDGVIATNTTVSRAGVERHRYADERGGLSGAPLRDRATSVVRTLHAALGERIPIIAAGGIASAQHAQEKIAAGAKLVQLYTGLVYTGPRLIEDCVIALRKLDLSHG